MKTRIYFFKISAFFLFGVVSAKAQETPIHHEHKAHAHGHANLAIAFEGLEGSVELTSPAESIYGFENEAKSEKQKKTVEEAFAKIEKNLPEIVAFPKDMNCVWTKEKASVEMDGKHSEVHAHFKAKCETSPMGRIVTINLQKHFPKVKEVDVVLLVNSLQKSAKVNKVETIIEIKNR